MAARNQHRTVSTRSSSRNLTTTENLTTNNNNIEHTSSGRLSSHVDHSTPNSDPSTQLEGEGEGGEVNVGDSTDHGEAQDDSTDANGMRRHRGLTRGVGIEQHVDRYGRIVIVVDEEDGKPTDENARKLSTECGCIVRQFAPLQFKKWSSIPMNHVKALFHHLLSKFDISAPHVCKFLHHNMGRRFADYRHDLHVQFKKSKSLDQAQEKFPNLTEEDWNWMCTKLFDTPEFKELSAKNVISRSKLPFNHRGGSRSFLCPPPKPKPKKTPAEPPQQLQETPHEELEEPTQEQPQEPPRNDPIKLFYNKHWNTKNGWINEVAKSKYDQMIALLEEQANIDEPERLSKAQICETVLGTRSGYVKGLGYGPKPKSSSSSVALLRRENEELHATLKDKDSVIEQLQNQNKRLEKLEQNSSRWSMFEALLRAQNIELPSNELPSNVNL